MKMDKKQFTNLLNVINEAYYDAHSDPRNFGIDMSKLKPWERVIGGDIHDIPGGEEAWKKQQAEKEAKAKVEKPKTLPIPDNIDDTWDTHLHDNKFGISPEAHETAKQLMNDIRKSYTSELPGNLDALHRHLVDSGVNPDHPHLKTIRNASEEAAEMNRDKARSRAGL